MAISAIDMAEGLGIDTDGDGDLSGFDGSRPTLEEAIRQESSDSPEHDNTWSILGSSAEPSDINQDEHPMGVSDFSLTYVKSPKTMKSSGIQTPKRIIPAISLSIAGHSFWNGSSFLSFFAPTEWFGFDDGQGVAFMLSLIHI